MKNDLKNQIIKEYLKNYKGLLESKQVDQDTVLISFPFHFSGSHRVEVAVTRIGDQFLLSDMARTIGEMKLSGYVISRPLRQRLMEIGKEASVEVKRNELRRMCPAGDIGIALQSFAESAKTIGDAYLVHKPRPAAESRIFETVKDVLDKSRMKYQSKLRLDGALDQHPIDFYMPPNGKPGYAFAVLARQDTHTLAQIWDFKCRDLRDKYPDLKIGLIYDIEDARWTSTSQKIIEQAANAAIPSNQVEVEIPPLLGKAG